MATEIHQQSPDFSRLKLDLSPRLPIGTSLTQVLFEFFGCFYFDMVVGGHIVLRESSIMSDSSRSHHGNIDLDTR